ncbi:hypothetical protein [Streptomyces luteocolor]|nr:hypothetical protein [Streptomyces luteocolor]
MAKSTKDGKGTKKRGKDAGESPGKKAAKAGRPPPRPEWEPRPA